MGINPRKLAIGLVVLGGLLLVYLAYAQLTDTPEIPFDEAPLPGQTDSDPNGVDDESGTAQDSDQARLKEARFEHKNDAGKVDRIFGFDVLTYAQGGQAVLTNPYMKLIYETFGCDITDWLPRSSRRTTRCASRAG